MIMSPEQAISMYVQSYPLLFCSISYMDTKLKVYDHIFNTVGNGITKDGFHDTLSVENVVNADIPDHLIDASPVVRDDNRILPDMSEDGVIYANKPKTFNKTPFKDFYPNFNEQYSLVYKVGMEHLPYEWLKEAVWFYTKAKELLSESTSYYLGSDTIPDHVFPFIDNTLSDLEYAIKQNKEQASS